jgi:hypothetical protein
MPSYRKPTEKETAKLDAARKKTQEGIEGEKDIFSKVSTTAAKAARDDVKAGLKMRESVPAAAREGEAYEQAGYKKGGKVMGKTKRYNTGGDVDLDAIVRKAANIPAHKKTTETTSTPTKSDNSPTPNINEIVRQSMGEKNYKEPKVTSSKEEKTKYTGPEVNINDLVKTKLKAGGKVSSASSRADGCAIRGKTRA